MSMPTPTGRNGPQGSRPLELRQRARDIANFAEYLAEDVRDHPDRAREATGALAEWCEDDPELLAHARTEVLRHRSQSNMSAPENNHYAVQLLDRVDNAS